MNVSIIFFFGCFLNSSEPQGFGKLTGPIAIDLSDVTHLFCQLTRFLGMFGGSGMNESQEEQTKIPLTINSLIIYLVIFNIFLFF
ncbi:hypothetical protein CISIN_1g041484mg [Citrus sinensis]|uniref:Uncharacterized protein n=1 Tax=Citrus sinensis TaxID=2711 RepID=A0A067DMX6_CITSI|nr:hypothetical protein CISIN_1g041484mg [Citrus sinensis]